MRIISTCMLSAFLFSPMLPAITIYVPGDYPTIHEAVIAADDGDTILVADGIYKEAVYVDQKALTIKSINGYENCIVDGDNAVTPFIFWWSDCILDGFTILNGFGCSWGGGVSCFYSKLLVQNCFFDTPYTFHCGGGIGSLDSELLVCNNGFSWCGCWYYGGGIASKGGTVAVWDNFFDHCGAGGGNFLSPTVRGGAIYLEDCEAAIYSNYLYRGMVTLWRSCGAGIAAVNSYCRICGNYFDMCREAKFKGGAIFVDLSNVTYAGQLIISDNFFVDSKSVLFGGAIYVSANKMAEVYIEQNNIVECIAKIAGGGVCAEGSGKFILRNNRIRGCRSGSHNTGDSGRGGGCYFKPSFGNENSGLYIINNDISINKSWGETGNPGYGGALFIKYDSIENYTAHIYNTVFDGNNALYHDHSDNLCISSSNKGLLTVDFYNCWYVKETNTWIGRILLNKGGHVHEPPVFYFYNLAKDSPCIDAGENKAPYLPPKDYHHNRRIYDGDYNGSFVVDIGPYEFYHKL